MPETLKVVIADDDPGMRLIVRKMVERVDGFTLVGEAANGDELMTLVEEASAGVLSGRGNAREKRRGMCAHDSGYGSYGRADFCDGS